MIAFEKKNLTINPKYDHGIIINSNVIDCLAKQTACILIHTGREYTTQPHELSYENFEIRTSIGKDGVGGEDLKSFVDFGSGAYGVTTLLALASPLSFGRRTDIHLSK